MENECKITYFDVMGNKFEKVSKIRKTISFEKEYKLILLGQMEFYWDEIIVNYPYKEGEYFINDISGRNHLGYQCRIPAEEMNRIIEYFRNKW